MRIKSSAVVVLTLIALVSATGALATITRGQKTPTAPGTVDMFISTDAIFTGAQIIDNVGGIQFLSNDCILPNTSACTWTAVGTPGLTPQSITVRFFDTAQTTEDCTINDLDGLPVELIEFSVE